MFCLNKTENYVGEKKKVADFFLGLFAKTSYYGSKKVFKKKKVSDFLRSDFFGGKKVPKSGDFSDFFERGKSLPKKSESGHFIII